MSKSKIALALAALLTAGGIAADQNQSTADQQKEKKVVAGEVEAKKLLLLMDKDANGKVSRQEFMSFMEAEFDRLDKDKNGELDVKELTQMQFRLRGSTPRR